MNDNKPLRRIRNATFLDWVAWGVIIAAIIAMPGGLIAAWAFNNICWTAISLAGLAFFYFGS